MDMDNLSAITVAIVNPLDRTLLSINVHRLTLALHILHVAQRI